MEAMVDEIKIRAPRGLREQFEKMAAARHLKMADVVREALRDYATTHAPVKEEEVVQ